MSSINGSGAAQSAQSLSAPTQTETPKTGAKKAFNRSVSLPSKAASMPSVRSATTANAARPVKPTSIPSRSVESRPPDQSFMSRTSVAPDPGLSPNSGGDDSFSSFGSSFSSTGSFDSTSTSTSVSPRGLDQASEDLQPSPDDMLSATQTTETTESPEPLLAERKDTRSRKQKVGDQIRSGGRKLKSAVYGRAKRFLTGKNWKKIPPEVAKTFPEGLQAKVEERNDKLGQLDALKSKKLEWQQFERQFGAELDLLDAETAPKKGTFEIPDTGEKFVFSKSQSKRQKSQMLEAFKESFNNSAGYDNYRRASDESTDIDVQRANLKDQVEAITKELKAGIDQDYSLSESRQHAAIDQKTENRHQKLRTDKQQAEQNHRNVVASLQGQVADIQQKLSQLRETRDRHENIDIPAKKRNITRLEKEIKKEKGVLQKQYKQLSAEERASTTKDAFVESGLKGLKEQLKQEKLSRTSMQLTVSEYSSDRAELKQKQNVAKEKLKNATKKDPLAAELKAMDKQVAEQDKQARKERDHATDWVKEDRRAMKSNVKGRKL